jgi:uncharacterized protein (TIGR03435 family)
MLVQAVFWFHPLVWWIGTRMMTERERACDEAVLGSGHEPRVYAQGILSVCEFYVAQPLECVAGVTGADLKKRIEDVMKKRITSDLNFGKKALLAAAGVAAIAAPMVVGMLDAPRLRAQSRQRLAFEVASIRENKAPSERGFGLQFLPGGKFIAKGAPFSLVAATAFDVPFQSNRVTIVPEFLRKTFYDIEASAGEGAIPAGTPVKERDAKLRQMLQTLLEDRFKMMIRREMKDQPVYAVVIARGGPKLQPAKTQEKDCPQESGPGSCHIINGGQGRGIHAEAVNISDVATFVGNWADRPVVDKTGLNLLYNIQTTGWSPMRTRPPRPPGQEPTAEDRYFEDPSTPTLFKIFEQLGLTLEPRREPVEMFTIESAERPTEN